MDTMNLGGWHSMPSPQRSPSISFTSDAQPSNVPFWRALEGGHADTVRYALECRMEVDQTNAGGAAALSVAAQHGHAEVVSLLLAAGARVYHTDAEGRTALDRAAQHGHAAVVWLLLRRMGTGAERFLRTAAAAGDAEAVRRLLRTRAAVDEADEDGRTPLFVACENGHLAVATLLVGAGAAVETAMTNGRTPLFAASRNGHTAVVGLLLSAQAAVDEADEGGQTPLCVACENGHLEVATLLVRAGAAVEAVMNLNLSPPLYVAANNGHAAVAGLLLSAQAAVDRATNYGGTPLWAAAENGHTAVATLLMGARAAVDAADKGGRTPLWAAAKNGHTAVAQLLVSALAAVDRADKDNGTPLWAAAENGHTAVATLLMGARAAVDAADKGGRTPLYAAAKNGHTAVAQLLASAQAAVDRADNDGDPPLFAAADNGHTAVVGLLLSFQAAVNHALKDGRTPLYAAAAQGHTEAVRELVAAQASVDQRDNKGNTPLRAACFNGQLAVAKLLWESKADPTHSDNDGSTPLLAAAQEGFHLVVTWLLEVGADHRVADNEGDTPLWAAVQYQYPDCVEALLKADADANHNHPQTGQSALMRAAATGDRRSIDLLLSRGATRDVRDRAGFTVYYHADYTVEESFAPPHLEDLLELCGAPTTADTTALAKLLRDPFVDVNAGDKYLHWTPLMEAVLYGSAETVTYLVSDGADCKVQMFCGLTAAFWAHLRGDDAIRRALGAGVAVSDAEAKGLDRVREVCRRSPEAAELLAYNGVVAVGPSFPHEARRRPQQRRRANLSVQDRMADIATDTEEGQFYPANYQCPVSLYRFLTTDWEKFLRKAKEEGAAAVGPNALTTPTATEEEVLTLVDMAAEGRKAVVVHIAAPDTSLRPRQRKCPPEDVFALFCYTFESIAYQHSIWAMRNWDSLEAQATLELWRPFIYHCERALRQLPAEEGMVYRGIPIGFEAAQYGLGLMFVWPAFSSTSELLKVAKNFALQRTKAIIFVVNGQSGVSIRHCSRYPADPAEVLFPPNLGLEVKWLGRRTVLDQTNVLQHLDEYVADFGYGRLLEPYELTEEEAEAEAVVVVYCEEVADGEDEEDDDKSEDTEEEEEDDDEKEEDPEEAS